MKYKNIETFILGLLIATVVVMGLDLFGVIQQDPRPLIWAQLVLGPAYYVAYRATTRTMEED